MFLVNSNLNIKIISWNVRGLNAAARCLAVHETLAATPTHIACLQETKLQSMMQPLLFSLALIDSTTSHTNRPQEPKGASCCSGMMQQLTSPTFA